MKFNVDKHVEELDGDYGPKSKKKFRELYVQENEDEIPEEFKHFTNKIDKIQTPPTKVTNHNNNGREFQQNAFTTNQQTSNTENHKQDEITRKKIEKFDNSIYDQQSVIEDASMMKNDMNLKNVDWSGPSQANQPDNYC